MTQYFDLADDVEIPGRWHLGKPTDAQGIELNVWQFTAGRRLDIPPGVRMPQYVKGNPLDYSETAFGTNVVHARVVSLFERLGLQEQVQFFPVQVEGCAEPYAILNALRVVRCIDDARCALAEYWRPEDNRPEKLGGYRMVGGMRIDASQPGDAHIFRPQGWLVALVVSERLKQVLEAEGVTGTRFTPV